MAVVALIAYGSLYPFDFSASVPSPLLLRRPSRGDLVANLVLYLPLGLAVVASLRRATPAVALAAALAGGTVLSLAVEVGQSYAPARVASLTDVVLNAVSALAGGAAALAWRTRPAPLALPGGERPPLVPLALIGLWVASRCAPFVPTLDWQKWKDAVKPLLRWEDFSWVSSSRYALGWLVVAQAARIAWRGGAPLVVAGLVAAVLAAQVLVVGRVLRGPEVVGLAAAALAAPALARLPERTTGSILAALAVAVIVLEGLEPFVITMNATPFNWVPFGGALGDSLETNLAAMLEKAFLYGALLWTLGLAGIAPLPSLFLVVPLLGAIELSQRWLPGRSAEITDPLVAVGLAVLLHLARGPATTPAAAPPPRRRRRSA